MRTETIEVPAIPSTYYDRIQVQFERFHLENEWVYKTLVRLALQIKAKGYKNYSINGLFEVLRWETAIKTRNDEFRLNNSYRSRYSRKIMDENQDLRGFFETRTLAAAAA